jgi:hypothetical protein
VIWLASYPRSGNTFFRIVLHEVYGVESSEFHAEPGLQLDKNYFKYPIVKTHLPPGELKPSDAAIPAVYIVRDGRDALVSMARQRSEIIAPGSDYLTNLETAIRARDDTFFGGWSRNVTEWLERAKVVIRFEDLIRDPIGEVERIRPLIDLPEPDRSRLPSFDDLRRRKFSIRDAPEPDGKFFRRGKPGAWRDEMPFGMHMLFWELHGDAMKKLGYTDGLRRMEMVAPWFVAARSVKRLFTGFYFKGQKASL